MGGGGWGTTRTFRWISALTIWARGYAGEVKGMLPSIRIAASTLPFFRAIWELATRTFTSSEVPVNWCMASDTTLVASSRRPSSVNASASWAGQAGRAGRAGQGR